MKIKLVGLLMKWKFPVGGKVDWDIERIFVE
jgi:hypothetical protein